MITRNKSDNPGAIKHCDSCVNKDWCKFYQKGNTCFLDKMRK